MQLDGTNVNKFCPFLKLKPSIYTTDKKSWFSELNNLTLRVRLFNHLTGKTME
jgi:hypothetical protein